MERMPETKRTTLYRMFPGTTFRTALVNNLRPNTEIKELRVAGRPARLVWGTSDSRPKWAADVERLTSRQLSFSVALPGCLLLIEDSAGALWALSWGSAFHFINADQIDYAFGSRLVARTALPSEIKSLTRVILDHRGRVDRSSMPKGSTIVDLGVDGYGEVVNRIEARARLANLTVGDRDIQIRAGESVNLPLAKDAIDLVADLLALSTALRGEIRPGLESLEQLVALKSRDQVVPELERELVEAIISRRDDRLGISWPHERLGAYGPVVSCRATGFGDRQSRVVQDTPDLATVLDWLDGMSADDVPRKLKDIRIELHSEAEPECDTMVSAAVQLRRWLIFETIREGQRFCLHDGQWYRMDVDYLRRIDSQVEKIMSPQASIELPPWAEGLPEADYNKSAAHLLGGYCLDRRLIHSPLHARGGIEPCDIFLPPGTLIHVKKGEGSAALSHLLAQALVSTDALARDEHARLAWSKRIAQESSQAITEAEVKEVVLAIARKRPLTGDSLFTFTKVNLVKQLYALRSLDVKVSIAAVQVET